MNRKIAIGGASGLIGSALARFLQHQGDVVHRLVRSKPIENGSDIYWNYQTGEIDTARLEGIDVVIHLAVKALDEQRWTPAVKEAIFASRIKATTFLSSALIHLKTLPRLF